MNLSSKLDAVTSRLEQAYKTQALTENMGNLTNTLTNVLKSSDLVKVRI